MTLLSLDHVQLAIPPHVEELADEFYVGLLGFVHVEKPAALAPRGGCWYEQGPTRLHLGADSQFVPSAKAHVAFRVSDYDELKARLRATNVRVTDDDEIPGLERFYTWDPFGNRLEMIRG